MPVESAIFTAAVVLLFLIFAVTLAWAHHQTESMHEKPARHPRELDGQRQPAE